MKIRKLNPENQAKVTALLQQAFPDSRYEGQLVDNLHKQNRVVHEWVCLHVNSVIAYVAFTNAYEGTAVCGLHLAPLAVKPDFQRQGVGSELLRFALRQEVISTNTVFVLGNPKFYRRFGFASCTAPICPFDKKNTRFLGLRNVISQPFVVGYEPEFSFGKR